MPSLVLLAGLAVLLAYGNGSNDVSKGIATLVGSGVTNVRTAVLWGALWTAGGGLAAAFASQGLVATFSGSGLLGRPITGASFPAAVALGAIGWVLLASRAGLPVSTTHAIAGALAGAALAAEGPRGLHWGSLAANVAVPLAISPVLALALMYALFPLLSPAVRRVGRYCVCIEQRTVIVGWGPIAYASVSEAPVIAAEAECKTSRVMAARVSVLDGLHWVSSATTSFARGLNDAPKILAVGAAASVIGIRGAPFYGAIAAAMGAGSLIAGSRVTRTLARRVTPMTPGEGFAANLVATLLVGAASFLALPVSTTHVCSGAIIGAGLQRSDTPVHWKTVREMGLAWVLTVPVAALAGAAAFLALRVL